MLNLIWAGMLVVAAVVAAINGRLEPVSTSALTAARSAVMDVALPLSGAMILWLGMMRLAERAGLISALERLIRPILRWLFPEVPAGHPAMGAMMMNVAANMLGVSNAATPLGLKAMTRLNELNRTPGVATNAMCTFLALNTSSVQLVPVTAINLLAISGSHNPNAILASTLVSTSVACVAALISVKVLERWTRVPSEPGFEPGTATASVADPPEDDPVPAPANHFARWAWWVLAPFFGLFACAFVFRAFPYFFGAHWPANGSEVLVTLLRALSALALPFLLAFFPLYALAKRISVYTEFIEGAKEGFQVAIRILPYLVGMLVAIAVFRESGALDLLKNALAPLLALLTVPAELLPMILMRPLSGSGSLAALSDVIKQFGADNLLSYTAATIYGSAETTFYVVAVYFGSVNITRTRHAIPVGLIADFTGALAAILVCRWMFG